MSRAVRPTDRHIAESGSPEERRVTRVRSSMRPTGSGCSPSMMASTMWPPTGLSVREVNAAESPWKSGAHYNLARSLEAEGNFVEAIKLLEEDTSPQQAGNKLRARELKSRPKPAAKADSGK